MRLTFFLTLLVATFVAIDIDFTINSADNTNNIASEPDTRHPEKGSHKAGRRRENWNCSWNSCTCGCPPWQTQ
ncbi:hypothetical protein PI125_g19789 [Phytophthora idaei]|nr:hypothetical protein PI125_g19789 [Phytophthora idaei]KAG3135484.1 hypothetical protein PI126_g18229 [Phytophthora idaei]